MTGAKEAARANVETAVVGTPSEVRAKVGEFIDAGANHFDIWFMYPTYDPLLMQLRLFANEIMPEFQ